MKETNTRKKSVILGAIMVMLIAVIAFGATTFAKYITSDTTDAQTARVAKWGFTVAVNADDLFSDAYNQGAKVGYTETSIDVKADTASTKIVAPGTHGSMSFTIDGTAEVLSKLDISMSEAQDITLYTSTTEDGATTVTEVYKPLKWTLKKKGVDNNFAAVTNCENVALSTIKTTLEGYSQNSIAVGAAPTNKGEYTLEWAWSFEDSTVENKDTYDTILGQLINGTTVTGYTCTKDSVDYSSVKLNLSISLEQIQTPAA